MFMLVVDKHITDEETTKNSRFRSQPRLVGWHVTHRMANAVIHYSKQLVRLICVICVHVDVDGVRSAEYQRRKCHNSF